MNVTVLKAFCVRGERVEVGSVVELTEGQARELAWRGLVSLDAAPPSGPMTTEDAAAIAEGRKARKTNA
jgi:hypothetical protein